MPKGKQNKPMDNTALRDVVRKIIVHHFGTKPRRITRQSGGLSNFVYSVEHDGDDLVVRINPDESKINPFLKEQWATARAREVGVPVAEILEVGDSPVPYMVLRKAAGEPATMHPERLPILKEMGKYAALINSVATCGFGATFDWAENRISSAGDWLTFLRTEFKLDKQLRTLARLRMVPADKADRLRAIVEAVCGQNRRPSLTHGDIRLKNVLVDAKGRVAALLDWEDCSSNLAPEWELSIALHDLSIDEKEAFLSGYGVAPKVLSAIAPTIKALNVLNYGDEVERLAKNGDADKLEHYRNRLHGDLDLYSF